MARMAEDNLTKVDVNDEKSCMEHPCPFEARGGEDFSHDNVLNLQPDVTSETEPSGGHPDTEQVLALGKRSELDALVTNREQAIGQRETFAPNDASVQERLLTTRSESKTDVDGDSSWSAVGGKMPVDEPVEAYLSPVADRFLVGPSEDRGREAVVSFQEEGFFNEAFEQDEIEMEILHRRSVRQDSYVIALEDEHNQRSGKDSARRQVSVRTSSKFTGRSRKAGIGRPLSQHETEVSVDDVVERSSWCRQVREWCRGRRVRCVCLTTAATCLLFFLATLLTTGVVYVEYYEIALVRNKVTGRVDRHGTYYPGCYLLAPGSEVIRFRGTSHALDLAMEVSTADGLVLGLALSVQYFINGEELTDLHSEYEDHYEDVMRSVIISQTKNAVIRFPLQDFRFQRAVVERTIYTSLSRKLQGDCCPSDCPSRWSRLGLSCNTCSSQPLCERGFHVTLRPEHVQLGAVHISGELADVLLRRTLLQIKAEEEELIQQKKVEMKLSERLTAAISNEAREIRERAAARSRLVDAEARASREMRVQAVHVAALREVFGQTNVTRQDQRLSLCMLLGLKDTADGERLFLAGYDLHRQQAGLLDK